MTPSDNFSSTTSTTNVVVSPPSYEQLFYETSNNTTSTTSIQTGLQQSTSSRLPLSSLQALPSPSCVDSESQSGGGQDNFRRLSSECLQMQLRDKYPQRYAVFHAVMLAVSSVLVIVLQVVIMVLNGALSEVATGIWCGAIGLLTLFFLIITSKLNLKRFYYAFG